MQLCLLVFSLFSIIGSVQGSEPYDYNPDVFDFGDERLINTHDEDLEILHEQEQIAHQSLEDWDGIEPLVATSEKRKYGRLYNVEFKIEVLEFCSENSTVAACEKFNVPYHTVWQWLKKEGKRKGKKYTEKRKTGTLELYDNGTEVLEICTTLKVPRTTLWRWHEKAEIDDGDKNRKRKCEPCCEDSDTGIKNKFKRRKYDEEFKMRAVKLYDEKNLNGEGISISEFCRDHKIPRSTFSDWMKESNDQHIH